MKVSVVIPVYNVENYIEKCLDSVVGQSHKNIEIILVNDGSTDHSGEICEKYAEFDSRIKVIHKDNGGQSDARNVGIELATGKWITFIDSDDYVTNDYIEFLLNLLEKNDGDISISSFYYMSSGKKIDKSTNEFSIMDSELAIKRMLLDDGFDMGPWAKMYRTEYFKKFKFPTGKFFEDSLTTYQILSLSNKVVFESKAIYFYVNHPDSTVNEKFNSKKLDLLEMTKSAETFIVSKYPNLYLEAHRRVVWGYFSTLNQVLASNNKDIIREYAPNLKNRILQEKNYIFDNEFIPKRDKLAFYALKLFGLNGYRISWKIYLKIKK